MRFDIIKFSMKCSLVITWDSITHLGIALYRVFSSEHILYTWYYILGWSHGRARASPLWNYTNTMYSPCVGYVLDEYIQEIEFLLPAPRCSFEGSLSLEKSDTLDTICTYEIGYPMKAMYRSECAHLLTTDKIVIFEDLDEIWAKSYYFIILFLSIFSGYSRIKLDNSLKRKCLNFLLSFKIYSRRKWAKLTSKYVIKYVLIYSIMLLEYCQEEENL